MNNYIEEMTVDIATLTGYKQALDSYIETLNPDIGSMSNDQ